jgi:hypothetical protein
MLEYLLRALSGHNPPFDRANWCPKWTFGQRNLF